MCVCTNSNRFKIYNSKNRHFQLIFPDKTEREKKHRREHNATSRQNGNERMQLPVLYSTHSRVKEGELMFIPSYVCKRQTENDERSPRIICYKRRDVCRKHMVPNRIASSRIYMIRTFRFGNTNMRINSDYIQFDTKLVAFVEIVCTKFSLKFGCFVRS